MVIQSNMSPKAIAEVWENTTPIFVNFNVPLNDMALETIIESNRLTVLLNELNNVVGSSTDTCIEGG